MGGGWADGQMNEFLPTLQDFVPSQGKGPADRMMPVGDWLFLIFSPCLIKIGPE